MNFVDRFFAWLRARRVRRDRTFIRVNEPPESQRSNWYSGNRNVQDEDAKKMRGHLSR